MVMAPDAPLRSRPRRLDDRRFGLRELSEMNVITHAPRSQARRRVVATHRFYAHVRNARATTDHPPPCPPAEASWLTQVVCNVTGPFVLSP